MGVGMKSLFNPWSFQLNDQKTFSAAFKNRPSTRFWFMNQAWAFDGTIQRVDWKFRRGPDRNGTDLLRRSSPGSDSFRRRVGEAGGG